LEDTGKQIVFAAMNVVYDQQGVQMIEQALQNTKSTQAIAPTVAMLAVALLHKMGEKAEELSDKEMWGKNGVVHVILDSIFEVAKVLGYKAPLSDLKVAYQIVEEQIAKEEQQGPDPDDDAQGGAPSSGSDPQMAQSPMPMMGGVMPDQAQGVMQQ
jgi:hypothetical protein